MSQPAALPTQFIDAKGIMAALLCSERQAYREMRAAAARAGLQRQPGKMQRIPLLLWERHIKERFTCLAPKSSRQGFTGSGGSSTSTSGTTKPANGSPEARSAKISLLPKLAPSNSNVEPLILARQQRKLQRSLMRS